MENTLTQLLLKHLEERPLGNDIFFTKEDDEYIPFKNRDLVSQLASVIEYFQKSGLKAGDKVAIISENCVEWIVIDFACMFLKLISIPVYPSLSVPQIRYILRDSESKAVFVSSSLLLEKVLHLRNELQELKIIISLKKLNAEKYNDNSIILYDNILKLRNNFILSDGWKILNKLSSEIHKDDLVTIIYTSGTTGTPKGVMLSHMNICSNVLACQKVLTINENDTFLSYLPYSHAYERTAGYYLALFSGAKIYYAQNIETLSKQLSEVHPTIVITVPRLLDKIYAKLIRSGEDMKDGVQKKIFNRAIKVAEEKSISKNSLKWKIANQLVYKKIRQKTGSRLRFFVSGGGALNKSIGIFFEKIGITILEGYGMTEASPVISVNLPDKNKYGTVGKALDGVEIKLSSENEILVKGDLIMKGYYRDEKCTNETIVNGWLHTGDIGAIDKDGYLRIIDRKKSLIKTSGGKYVSPTQIEDLIMQLNYVENILVIGDGKMYMTGLIVPDKKELLRYAEEKNIKCNSYRELLNNTNLLKLIQNDINNLQKDFSNYERVRKFTLLSEPFSIEGGELTPTMKIKRKFVEEKFRNEIEKMYLKI